MKITNLWDDLTNVSSKKRMSIWSLWTHTMSGLIDVSMPLLLFIGYYIYQNVAWSCQCPRLGIMYQPLTPYPYQCYCFLDWKNKLDTLI